PCYLKLQVAGFFSNLLVRVQLPGQGGEASIVAKRIEPRIDFDRDEIEAAVLAGLRQPGEAEIDVAQREMNPGEFERRDVAPGRVGFQLLQHLERLLPLSRQRKRSPERAVHARRLR